MRTRLGFTAVLAVLALSGCSSAETGSGESSSAGVVADQSLAGQSANTPAEHPVTPAASPTPSGQEWADEKVSAWVANSGIKSVKGFLYPYNLINSWDSPKDGHLRLFIDDSYEFNRMERRKATKPQLTSSEPWG